MQDPPSIQILYIEDDAGSARLFQRRLGRLGYTVEIAPDGQRGLARFRETAFDIIAIDQHLPGMDGLQVIQAILAESGMPPPMIMITGAGDEQIAIQALKHGASDYIVKDAEGAYIDLMPSVIQQLMERQHLQREKERAESENARLLITLQQQTLELQQRNEELDAFSRMVAHDLKNPITSALGHAQYLKRRGGDRWSDNERQSLDHLELSVRRMREIIDDLLVLSGIRNQQVTLEPLNMAVIVQNALDQLAYMPQYASAQITLPPDWPPALGQPSLIQQVWVNYLSNALKYGGEPAVIYLQADSDGAIARFGVIDNGQGMTPEQQAILFRPFARLGGERAEGHGLGLSIVRRIIERLGGQVGIVSQPGMGSTFYFTLPMG